MSHEQIAHDLAVSKLCGSELPTKELIEQYRQYYGEILSELKSEPAAKRETMIMSNPF